MLDRAHRLRRRDEFTSAVRHGRRARRGTLVVHLLPGTGDVAEPPRAGFIVSRAVGPAVVRNRVRRRLRHLIRSELGALPPGTLVAVRALPASAQAPASRLARDLGEALAAARPRRSQDTAGPTASPDTAAGAT